MIYINDIYDILYKIQYIFIYSCKHMKFGGVGEVWTVKDR